MPLLFKTKRSAGVRVTPAVHRAIAQASAARDRQAWAEAMRGYQQALAADPALAHIWVQLGHAAKEQGEFAAAEAAYRQAIALQPLDADALLQLGHLFNRAGDAAQAGEFYLQAFRADPNQPDAVAGLHRVLGRSRGAARAPLVVLLRQAIGAEDEAPVAPPPPADLVFDVSDLVQFFGGARVPTGIQRVQIEVIHTVLDGALEAGLCCFVDGRDEWVAVPTPVFRALTELSLVSGDTAAPDWLRALNRLHLHIAMGPPLAFAQGACLVTLGASWNLHNYFLLIREAKARHGIRYVPLVFDLIPVLMPEHCVATVAQDFLAWVTGVFDHADHFLAISECTRRDLLCVAATLGHDLVEADVTVIPLDADFRKPALVPLPDSTLSRWSLEAGTYVLLVSTIESRKGHAVALDAWRTLIDGHGAAVPRLVCVGGRGWLNGAVYRRLQDDPALAARVTILHGLSDEELALLYSQAMFTIYPSLYEGWGLPVTESLCYGKPVIASNAASLPEAGGDLAIYVEPGSVPELAAAVARMAFDAPYRAGIAARIAAGFRPRRWQDVAAQIAGALVRLAGSGAGRPPRTAMAHLGAYHALRRSTARGLWPGAGSAEAFRTGTGWGWPGRDACWTRPEGGALTIGLPGNGAVRIGLALCAHAKWDCDWRLDVQGGPGLSGHIEAGGRAWVPFDAMGGQPLHLRLRGRGPDTAPADDRDTVGLAGFFAYEKTDLAAAVALLEAVTLGTLDQLDPYRGPTRDAPADGLA